MTRVLVVDDSVEVRQSVREALANLLADVGFGEAAGANEAIAALGREPWDLVLLDLSLPGSQQARGASRRSGASEPTHAIVVDELSHPEAEYAAAARAHGAAGYVAKGSPAPRQSPTP